MHATEIPPDLSSPEGRRVYRQELRSLAKGWRRFGFCLVSVGAILFVLTRYRLDFATPGWRITAWSLISLGWLIFISVIVYRTRYHKRRVAAHSRSYDA